MKEREEMISMAEGWDGKVIFAQSEQRTKESGDAALSQSLQKSYQKKLK